MEVAAAAMIRVGLNFGLRLRGGAAARVRPAGEQPGPGRGGVCGGQTRVGRGQREVRGSALGFRGER